MSEVDSLIKQREEERKVEVKTNNAKYEDSSSKSMTPMQKAMRSNDNSDISYWSGRGEYVNKGDLPLSVAAQAFRTSDYINNFKRMGFDVVRDKDPISGEEISSTKFKVRRGNEVYDVDINDTQNLLAGQGRTITQGIAGMGGWIAGAGAGPILGALTAGQSAVSAGQGYDLLLDQFEPSGRTREDVVRGIATDYQNEAMAVLGGEIGGRVAQDFIRKGVGPAITDAFTDAQQFNKPEDLYKPGITQDMVNTQAALKKAQVLDDSAAQQQAKMQAQVVDEGIAQPTPPTKQVLPIVEEAIAPGGATSLPQKMDARPEVLAAEKELGIEMPATAYTRDVNVLEAMQAGKESPGSTLKMDEELAIEKIGKELDDLVASERGSKDVALVNADVAGRFDRISQKAQQYSGELYDQVNAAMSPDDVQIPEALIDALGLQLKDNMGKRGNLSKLWQSMYDALKRNVGEDGVPLFSYSYIDGLRKRIGKGYSRSGDFHNADSRELDQVYGALQEAQEAMLARPGYEGLLESYQKAKKGTQVYKKAQEDAASFGALVKDGKVIDGPFVKKLESAVVNAARGDTTQLKRMMDLLPPSQRSKVIASALRPLFESRRFAQGTPTGVMQDAGLALTRNETAKKEIYKYLSPRTQKRLDSAFVLADALYYAKKRENTSGTAKAVNKHADGQREMLERLLGGADAFFGVTPTGKMAKAVAKKTKEAIKQGNVEDVILNGSPTARKMDVMLTSPEFKNALRQWLDGSPIAQDKLLKASGYDDWLKSLPKEVRSEVTTKGFFNFLFGIPARDPERTFDGTDKTSSIYGNAALQARIAQGDPTAISMLDNMIAEEGSAADEIKQGAYEFGESLLGGIGVSGNPLQVALDVDGFGSVEPNTAMKLINDLYVMSDREDTLPVARAFADIAFSNPELQEPMMGIKNVLQNNSIIPPDDKEVLIRSLIDAGVAPERAVSTANKLNKIDKKTANSLVASIRKKIPDGAYSVFKPLIDSIEEFA